MSKPRDRWWGYVRACIRAYPDLQARAGQLPPQEQRELAAVEEAVCQTRRLPDGQARLDVVDLVFWKQSHTLEGAAQAVHLSYRTARRRQNEFIRLVGEKMGFTEKLAPQSQTTVTK